MAKHTPGPWAIENNRLSAPEIVGIWRRGTRPVAKVLYHIGSEDPEVQANARLIAAAPDLLNVCEGILECLDAGDAWPKASRKNAAEVLRAAIAKAKGEHRATLTTSADEATQEGK